MNVQENKNYIGLPYVCISISNISWPLGIKCCANENKTNKGTCAHK